MLLAIQDVIGRKEAAEIQYRRIFESAKEGILAIDAYSVVVIDGNPFFLSLTRSPRGNRRPSLLGPSGVPQGGRRAQTAAGTMEKEVTCYDSVTLRVHGETSLIVTMIANRYRLRDQVLIQINIRNVTERRQAKEDFRRSNRDLQPFAFAASHDLQEPLRTVINQVRSV